jgi:hypothetical protein
MRNGSVQIERAAREHIVHNGGVVTLRGSRRHGCCGGTAFVPVAVMGPPDQTAGYRAIEIDRVTVFLQTDVAIGSDPLVIGLDELWRLKRLRVEGSAIWM